MSKNWTASGAVLLLLTLNACATSGFEVFRNRAIFRTSTWQMEMKTPQPEWNLWNGGWTAKNTDGEFVSWFEFPPRTDWPPRQVLAVAALDDRKAKASDAIDWASIWMMKPGGVGLVLIQQLATEVLYQGASERIASTDGIEIDLTPIIAKFTHGWGPLLGGSFVFFGHIACRSTPGVPVFACVMMGEVPKSLPTITIEQYFKSEPMISIKTESLQWVSSLKFKAKELPGT